MNSFGNIYRLTSFGESHGPAIGGVIDGFPAGVTLSLAKLREAMARRRPGGSGVSQRREADQVRILSGMMAVDGDGRLGALREDSDKVVTLGTPIGFIIENGDTRGEDYDHLREIFRPNHADFTTYAKHGIRDWRGGGRSSGRETAARVVAGALAEQYLQSCHGINIGVRIKQIGKETDSSRFAGVLSELRVMGDSVGGIVEGCISNVPVGLGEPTFGKLQQMLASAMLSIGGVHGFEYGDGFELAGMLGSEAADEWVGGVLASNHSGGIQGGISNGAPIVFRVAFKPTPSIRRELRTIDTHGRDVTLRVEGRHDPCIAIRGAEVVRAMAAIVIMDAVLMKR